MTATAEAPVTPPPIRDERLGRKSGLARFLAAHTPTRRELPQVVRIASRLRRGEPLYEAEVGLD